MPMKNHVTISKTVTGTTHVYGIVGSPVTFSLSPMIHNTVSNFLGMNNTYVAFPVDEGNLKSAIKGAHALGIRGLNVTHPYKQDVMPMLTRIDPLALKIGAVNTLKYEDGGYSGYNTDANGLYTSLVQNNVSLEGQNIIVLGAGGAARAVCMMVAEYGAKSIYILNRTALNAESLAQEVKKYYNIDAYGLPMDHWNLAPDHCICFQTTSVGMGSSQNSSPVESLKFFEKISVAVDLIYNPFKTLFLKNAEQRGIYTINGFGMLFYQGIKAYEIWNDIVFNNTELKLLLDKIEEEYIRMNV